MIVHILGGGLVAGLFHNVTKIIGQQSVTAKLDPTPCLPDPVPPDWNRYCQILALVLMCWLLALCEPYGLRLRHSVMITYHPDRARERAIWLYNRIISNRINFAKTARRQLRRRYRDIPQDAFFRFQFMKSKKNQKCLLCKVNINPKQTDNYKCPTENCVGLYCLNCFESLKICSICTDPADYGDLSDLSEEKDSSDDDESCKRNVAERPSREKILSSMSTFTYNNSKTSSKRKSQYSPHQYGRSFPSSPRPTSKIAGRSSNLSNVSDSSDWESEISIIGNKIDSEPDVDISTDFEKLLLKCQPRKTGNRTSRSLQESPSSSRRALSKRKSRSCEYVGLNLTYSDSDAEAFDEKNIRSAGKTSKPDFRFKRLSKSDIDDDYKPGTFLNVKDSLVCLRDRNIIRCEYVSRVSSGNELSVVSSFHRKLGDALEKGFLLSDDNDEDTGNIKTMENPYLPSPSIHYFDDVTKKGAYVVGDAIIEEVASAEKIREGGSMARGTCIKEEVLTPKESVPLNKDVGTPRSKGHSTKIDTISNSESVNLEVSQSSDSSSSQFYSPVIKPQPRPKPESPTKKLNIDVKKTPGKLRFRINP